eukprot:TRINITY_DN10807_c0_g1_i1.p1 TRINITY_DN10807_c0_g1~~TRINITY_DN10807_c0_g1_i1.p1  ORF type:complete len:451 (-),score=64.10 TRINITY_DN10807_c0_g1_i1:160-1512(-)
MVRPSSTRLVVASSALIFLFVALFLGLPPEYLPRIKIQSPILIYPPPARLPRIDIIYTYVNGSDPIRYALKQRHLDMERGINSSDVDFVHTGLSLARDNDEMLFSMRSISSFLPWFNGNIYIVADQVPCWLNTSHPQIKIISPLEFMPPEHSPTFNSHAIEAHLWRVPELSEYFIYLNDDYMFGSNIPKHYYYGKDGCINLYHEERMTLTSHDNLTGWNIHRQAMKNSNIELDKKFGFRDRYYLPHAPHFIIKSIMKKMAEEDFVDAINLTSQHKFRSWTDVHPVYLFTNYLLEKHPEMHCSRYKMCKNRCHDGEDYCIKLLRSLYDAEKFFMKITHGPPRKFYSINDHVEDDSNETEAIMTLFRRFLWAKYPRKSPWELSDSHCRPNPFERAKEENEHKENEVNPEKKDELLEVTVQKIDLIATEMGVSGGGDGEEGRTDVTQTKSVGG